ncbi:unnamed protein product [Tuber aestivum]|uniref:Uncharacterized protein n=1 Tax=Tuber aestivum TaxID=59557 RepID=A0A292Q8I3_9PEZI|nr:unnamed protein product [Tuber aestivum]
MLPSKLLTIIPRRRALFTNFHLLHRFYLSTKNSPTVHANFFKRYDFSEYTFTPTNPVDVEFERLAKARQWKEKGISKHSRLLERAVRVAEFFERFEDEGAGGYVYDAGSDRVEEFWRMCNEKGWEGRTIKEHKKEFETLIEEKISAANGGDENKTGGDEAFEGKTPVQKFLMRNQHPGYSFTGQAPEIELWELLQAEKKAWEWKTRGCAGSTRYGDTKEFKTLLRRFNYAMEESLVPLLDGEKNSNSSMPWKIIFEQFDLGKPPTNFQKAKKILREFYVNILDYLELVHQSKACGTPSTGVPQPGSPAEFHRLRFPTLRTLAIYSYVTGRVYRCGQDGLLAFFLQLIEREYAESEFTAGARNRGCQGDPKFRQEVRELLREMNAEDWSKLDEEIKERVGETGS